MSQRRLFMPSDTLGVPQRRPAEDWQTGMLAKAEKQTEALKAIEDSIQKRTPPAKSRKRVSDEQCLAAYEKHGHLGQAAAALGINKSSLHGRLIKLGISTARARAWSPQDDAILRCDYLRYRTAGRVIDLAKILDRTVGAVCTRAFTLGLSQASIAEAAALPEQEHYRRSQEDRFRAMGILMAIGASDESIEVFVLDGDPMSKARARFSSRSGAFTPAAVVQAQKRWIARLKDCQRYNGNVAVACIFVRASMQRIDVDNMLKLVLDGCTQAGVWADDSQVTAINGIVEFDPYEPRTILAIAKHKSTMQRGEDNWPKCATCGKPFNRRSKGAKFCSQDCRRTRPVVEP